jgi:hypothetical protein
MKTAIVSCSLAIGLLLFATTGPTSANLIVNGDFETGTFAGWTTMHSVPTTIDQSRLLRLVSTAQIPSNLFCDRL